MKKATKRDIGKRRFSLKSDVIHPNFLCPSFINQFFLLCITWGFEITESKIKSICMKYIALLRAPIIINLPFWPTWLANACVVKGSSKNVILQWMWILNTYWIPIEY